MNSVYIYRDNGSNANQNLLNNIILTSKNDAQQWLAGAFYSVGPWAANVGIRELVE